MIEVIGLELIGADLVTCSGTTIVYNYGLKREQNTLGLEDYILEWTVLVCPGTA